MMPLFEIDEKALQVLLHKWKMEKLK